MRSRLERIQSGPRRRVRNVMLRALAGLLAALLIHAEAGSLQAGPMESPSASPIPRKGRAYFLYSLSQQAQFERNYVDALKYLEEAVQSDDCADLRVELADLFSSLNQGDEAEEQARKALGQDPGNVEARRLLAQVLVGGSSTGEVRTQRLGEAETIYRGLVNEGKADVDSVMALADLQMGRGDVAAARATLEAYRSSHPESTSVDMELARIFQQSGHPEEAIPLLQGVVNREKDNREARNALGNSLEDAGRFEEAAQAYQGLVDQTPNNPYGHYRLAIALLSLRRYREAQEHLTTALSSDPGNVHVLLGLGQAYEGANDLKLAEGAYRQVLERDPTSMEARFFLARILQARGEDDEALALYGEILSRNSAQESPQEKAFYSVAATQVGGLRLLQKNYPAALESLGHAFQASDKPSNRLYALLGRAYLEAGMTEEAGKTLAEGREKYPDDTELAAAEGEFLLRNSRPEEARRLFRDLLERAHRSEDAYLEVIQACLKAEKPREAEPWIEEGAKQYPESRDLAFQAAALNEQIGRFKQAEHQLRDLIRKDPRDGEALNYLGYMLADRGVQLEDALGMLEQAVALEPENIAYLDSLGWVNYRLGRFDKAETYLARAARGSRMDPTILDHLGDVRAALGRKSEALEAFRTALEHNPEKPEEIRKKIRKLENGLDRP